MGGGGDTEAHQGGRVAWVSSRRATPAADTIASKLAGRYVLSDVLDSKDAPLTEIASVGSVMMELPPVMKQGFERTVLDTVAKIASCLV